MTRISSRAFVALAVAAGLIVCGIAEAQQRPGGRQGPGRRMGPGGGPGFGMMGKGQLLRVEKVQKELGIDSEKAEQIQAALRPERQGDRPDFREMSDTQRQEFFAKMRKERLQREAKVLGEQLSEEQNARLNEIYLQILGFNALGTPEAIKGLGIGQEQGAQLGQIRTEMREKLQDLREKMFGNFRDLSADERRTAMREGMQKMAQESQKIQKEAMEKAFAGPLKGKQEQWKKLLGEPLELTPQDLFRGRGRGGMGGMRRGPGGGGRQ